jgi:Amt family ammonium transporter
MEHLRHGKATTLGFASGAVAGLVAITPAAGFVGFGAAAVIGAAAGVICFLALQIKFMFNFDDALDVVAVHLVGGILGSLMVGLFGESAINSATQDGLFFGGGVEQLWRQAAAVGIAMGYSFVVTLIIGFILNAIIGLRVEEQDERRGLDLVLHEEQSYVLAE